MKILWWSDSPTVPTGFGRVARELLNQLHSSGHEVRVVGINYDGKRPHDLPYKVYPARGKTQIENMWHYMLGMKTLEEVARAWDPDVIVLFQDLWNIYDLLKDFKIEHPFIVYTPIDAPNLRGDWVWPLAGAKKVISYTDFAVAEINKAANHFVDGAEQSAKEQDLPFKNIVANVAKGQMVISPESLRNLPFAVVPHGTDTDTFHPVQGPPTEKFIVLSVGRNQPRKRLDVLIRAFSLFAKDKPEARLAIHCFHDDGQGWDLMQLADYYGCIRQVDLTHEILGAVTDAQLNELYNMCDVFVNTSGGEGWGLPIMEAAACRKPVIVPKWSATEEIWKGAGLLTEVESINHSPGMVNTIMCQVSAEHLASQMQALYESETYRQEIADKCYAIATNPELTWKRVAEKFEEVLLSAMQTTPRD